MSLGSEICLGLVQGLTEFLPVSSSGHLQALKAILESPLARDLSFDIFVHFATLLAVACVFWPDFVRIGRGVAGGGDPAERREARRYLGLIILGATPAAVVGLLLRGHIESLPERWPMALSFCWLFTAAALLSLRFRRGGDAGDRSLGVTAALWIGAWQCLALLPGVSRSGITICAALWFGCRRDEAARFSFLCATPLIVGATALQVLDLWSGPRLEAGVSWLAYSVGGAVAFVSGYFALRLLLKMLEKGALHWWAGYLMPLAVAYAVWVSWGRA